MKRSLTPLEIRSNNRKQKFLTGFTLIELIVVIAIIAILAAIIAPNAFKAIEKAMISKAVVDLKTIKTVALAYYADTGQLPPDDDSYFDAGVPGSRHGIDFLENKAGITGWDGPYLESWPYNPFWKTIAGNREEGYQWEGLNPSEAVFVDFDGDGQKDPSVEMLFGPSLPTEDRERISEKIDGHIDDGNISTGNFRVFGNTYYRIVIEGL